MSVALSDFAKNILFGSSLDNKLTHLSKIEFDDFDPISIPVKPERSKTIEMDSKNVKFPKGHFHLNDKKAIALHSFANHELLAIEMMACALLIYPHNTPELVKFKRGIISTIADEQKHLQLYIERLNELGYEFGDFVLNDFFWRQMQHLDTPQKYLSVMALTFEAANLDFAFLYKGEFEKVDDNKTANILDIVLKDEIAHVQFGVNFLNKWRESKSLQEYYLDNLPGMLTPARAKGQNFQEHLRKKTKMDDSFIQWLKSYQDEFKVTNRREWK